jgi:hypothetical protein
LIKSGIPGKSKVPIHNRPDLARGPKSHWACIQTGEQGILVRCLRAAAAGWILSERWRGKVGVGSRRTLVRRVTHFGGLRAGRCSPRKAIHGEAARRSEAHGAGPMKRQGASVSWSARSSGAMWFSVRPEVHWRALASR